jgi:hypothetical protein
MAKCKGTNRKGKPCGSDAMPYTKHCWEHHSRWFRCLHRNWNRFKKDPRYALALLLVVGAVKGGCLGYDRLTAARETRYLHSALIPFAEAERIRKECEKIFPEGYILFTIDGKSEVHYQKRSQKIGHYRFNMADTYVESNRETPSQTTLIVSCVNEQTGLQISNCRVGLNTWENARNKRFVRSPAGSPVAFLIDKNDMGMVCVLGVLN